MRLREASKLNVYFGLLIGFLMPLGDSFMMAEAAEEDVITKAVQVKVEVQMGDEIPEAASLSDSKKSYWQVTEIKGDKNNPSSVVLELRKGTLIRDVRQIKLEVGSVVPGRLDFDGLDRDPSLYRLQLNTKSGFHSEVVFQKYFHGVGTTVMENYEVGKTKFEAKEGKRLPQLPSPYMWKKISREKSAPFEKQNKTPETVTYRLEINPEEATHLQNIPSRFYRDHLVNNFEWKASKEGESQSFLESSRKALERELGRPLFNPSTKKESHMIFAEGRTITWRDPKIMAKPAKRVSTVYNESRQTVARRQRNAKHPGPRINRPVKKWNKSRVR